METAKVDIRKLQLLNDRISQVTEALNQVRLSVHGLSHTGQLQSQQQGVFGQGPYAAMQSPVAGIGAYPPMQQGPFGQQPVFSQGQAFPQQGLSHTSPQSPYGMPGIAQQGYGWNPYAGIGQEELSRLWNDPFLQQRVAQTFPFAYAPYGLPPVVSI